MKSIITNFKYILLSGLISANISAQNDEQKTISAAPITVFTIGDSTMSDYAVWSSTKFGWAQVLGLYFNSSMVVVDNDARSGRSAKTFISEGLWRATSSLIKSGDYVFIQFGHNDEKDSNLAEYRSNLAKFIKETRQKGATPILLTPITRRTFNGTTLYNSHILSDGRDYPATVRTLASDSAVQLIDMTQSSMALVQSLGVEGSKSIYLHLNPGDSPDYPNGIIDNTHLSEYGANEMAKLGIVGLKSLNSPLVAALEAQTSINSLHNENIRFRLSENKLQIINPRKGALSLYNLTGRLVRTISIDQSQSIINFHIHNKGIYFIHFTSEEGNTYSCKVT